MKDKARIWQEWEQKDLSYTESAIGALDEWGEQVAVGFANWIDKEGYIFYTIEAKWRKITENKATYTTSELFKKYLNKIV